MTTKVETLFAALREELRKPPHERKSKSTLNSWRREIQAYNLGARDSWPELPEPELPNFSEVVKLEQNRATAFRKQWGGLNHAERS